MSKPAASRRSRSLRTKLLVAAFSVVLALAGAEVAARLIWPHMTPPGKTGLVSGPWDVAYDTPRGRRLIPNTFVTIRSHPVSGLDVPIKINERGFRDEPIAAIKPPNQVRILAIGDSITGGDYLPADQVYVKRLEHYLNTDPPVAGKSYRLINAGLGDIGLIECINILEDTGIETEPDVVLLGFYLNDSRPPWGFPQEIGSPGWLRKRSVLLDVLYRRFRLKEWEEANQHRFVWTKVVDDLNWMHDRADFMELAGLAAHDWGAAWDESSWTLVNQQLGRLDSLSNEHGFKVIVAMFPVRFQVQAEFVEDTPQKRMQRITDGYGWTMVDLLPTFRENGGRRLLFDQCHPTEEGNDLVGRVLAERLSNTVLADLE